MDEFLVKVALCSLVLSLLPVSPFTRFISWFENIPYLAALNWFVPISDMIVVLEIWLPVIAVFYGIMWILNFVGVLKN